MEDTASTEPALSGRPGGYCRRTDGAKWAASCSDSQPGTAAAIIATNERRLHTHILLLPTEVCHCCCYCCGHVSSVAAGGGAAALKRKGKGDDVSEEHMDAVVRAHNGACCADCAPSWTSLILAGMVVLGGCKHSIPHHFPDTQTVSLTLHTCLLCVLVIVCAPAWCVRLFPAPAAMNEATWRRVMDWEQLHCQECRQATLLKFQGRPHDLRCPPGQHRQSVLLVQRHVYAWLAAQNPAALAAPLHCMLPGQACHQRFISVLLHKPPCCLLPYPFCRTHTCCLLPLCPDARTHVYTRNAARWRGCAAG